ncbi:MAG: tetratricopeptide repeat protein [Elusimicrobia bacterium]|nr:tetratricopeptide repeat protein [Elusimicrobiota bacterium]
MLRGFVALLAAFACLGTAPSWAGDKGLARRYFDEGLAQYKHGDLEPALASLSKAITENPTFLPAYSWRAQVRYALGGGRFATDDVKRALDVDVRDIEGYLARGGARLAAGEERRAISDFEEVLRADPENADAYTGRGRAYRAEGDTVQAVRDWTEALRLDPSMVLPRYNRGQAYFEAGKLNYAVDDLARALRTNPKFPLPYALLAVIFAQRGDLSRAIQAYNKAIFLNPNYVYAYLGRATAQLKKGDKDAAMRDFEEAIRVAPESYAPLYERGEAKYRLGDKDGALADFRAALQTSIDHTPSAVAMGNRLAAEGLHKEAVAMFSKGVEAVSAGPAKSREDWLQSSLIRRAAEYETLGEAGKALSDLDDLVARSSWSVTGWTARGRLLFKQQKDADALTSLDRALLLDPKHVPARVLRGRVQAAAGRNKEALEDFNAAVKYGPDAADAFSSRGLLYEFSLGDDDKALADLTRSVQLAPRDPEAHLNMGDVLYQRREYDHAVEAYDQALALKGPASRVLQHRAQAHFRLGDLAKAVGDLRAALEVDPKNGDIYSLLGLIRMRSHDYVQAERDLGQAAEVGPDDFQLHFAKGVLAGDEKRYEAAISELKKASSVDDRSAETLGYLCRAYRLNREPKDAVKACTRAIELDGRLGMAFLDRGFAFIALRDYESAVQDLYEGHKLGARFAPAQLARSVAHATLRQYRESDEAYRLAMDIDPLAREPDMDFDLTPLGKPDYYTLMGELEKALNKDQGNPYVFLLRGNAIGNAGYFDRAILEYTKVMEMDGSIAAAYLDRGAALAAQQSYEAAEQDYRRAVELTPRDPEAHARLLTLLAVRRRFDAGVASAAEAIRLMAKEPEIYLRAGNLRYFLKDIRRAQENYTLALGVDARYPDAYNGLGLCLFASRKYPEAIQNFSRAIAFNDHNDRFYRNRAAAWMNEGEFANAAADYRNALAVNTDPDMIGEYQKLVQTAQAQAAPGADSLPRPTALPRLPATQRRSSVP